LRVGRFSWDLIQDRLGEIEVLLEVGDRLLESVARDADAGRGSGNAPAGIRHVVLENAIRVVDIALRIAGNTGICRDHPLELPIATCCAGAPMRRTVFWFGPPRPRRLLRK
jgi:alkylation response protein AidB-like acyl-CoA dehydrogenase